MIIAKRILMVFIAAVVVTGSGFFAIKITSEQQIKKAINSGLLIIDQEMHEWGTCNNYGPVKISIWVRNNSQHKVEGMLVFSATLSKEGLEEKFIIEFIECFGEEKLQKEFKEEIEKKGSLGHLMAVYNYMNRGKQLPQGKKFEPTQNITGENDYIFKFRERLLLRPGELRKIYHEEQLPLNVRGHVMSLMVDNIEF